MEEWKSFFAETAEPINYEDVCTDLKSFCAFHQNQRPLVLVTSGGTTVPLERNTVRFVDNFSAGTRGAASTEYFLLHEYAVVFLSREKSVQPYARHFDPQVLINSISENENGTVQINEPAKEKVQFVHRQYKKVVEENRLFKICFISLSEYLWFLRAVTEVFNSYAPMSLLYLAAAVSDFYIPQNKMTEHKIQSSTGPLNVTLQLVPKMLNPLVSLWGPQLYVVSFKLETDKNVLSSKALDALERYKHKLVIGNLLHTRRTEVIFVASGNTKIVRLSEEQKCKNIEIEELIVDEILELYKNYIKT